jgi:hypothetical protein
MRDTLFLIASTIVLFVPGPITGQDASKRPQAEPLDVEMFYQFSETDNDAEVTIDIESGRALESLVITGPDGRTVATVRSTDDLGLAAIEFESAEPSVEEVQRAYPEGGYRFSGRAVDGTNVHSRIGLTHGVVAAPDFFNFNPCNQEVDSTVPVTVAWNPVDDAAGGYEIIVEQDDTGANFRSTLSPAATRFVIPDGFLAPGLEYEIEMKSVAAGGNKTSASCEFSTR